MNPSNQFCIDRTDNYSNDIYVVVFIHFCRAGHALECFKATSAIDKAICQSPLARKSDEEMSRAYFSVLSSLSDKDERDALIASQRRWLAARRDQDETMYEDTHIGLSKVLKNQSDERRSLFERRDGAEATVVSRMRMQRSLLKEHSGRFAGFNAGCFIIPPPFGAGSYYCTPMFALQKGNRLCRREEIWAPGHETEVWTIAKVESGAAVLLATCKKGYGDGSECPSNSARDADAGWTQAAGIDTPRMSDLGKHLRSLDPDMDVKIDENSRKCLSDVNYPAANDFVEDRK